VVYVAAFGHPAGRNPERGVFKSTDGGKHWRRVLYRDDKTGAIDLSMDARDPNVLYAAMWEAYRITWQMSSGGPGSGLFKSTDGGEHWTEITRAPGLPKGVVGRIGVSVSPADGRRVYAAVEAADGGIYRSDDAGATWARTSDERKLRQRAFYYTHITADPQLRDRVYVLNVGLFRSDDGGARFDTTIAGPHSDHHDLWIAPNDNRRMAEANDGGGTVSVNAGRTWTGQSFPTAQLYHVATTRDFPYHACGAQQDNSTACLPSRGWANLRGANSERPGDWMYDVGGGESGHIAPDPRDPNVFYAGSQGALLTRYDRRNGQIRDVQVYPRFFSGEPASALPERWQWTFPIVFAPTDPRTLFASSQHVWRTRDEGQTWARISPDLTRADPATLGPTGGPITQDMNGPEIYGTVFALAPSPLDAGVIWAGSDDGLAHVTRDGGRTWANVTPPGLPKFARVSAIDASRHAPGTAYLAAKNYLLDDRAPYLYRTRDFGRTWARVVAGIRADDYAHVVREDPARAGLLYAGTEHGVYVSWDAGDSWRSLSLKLPDTQVSDLVVEGDDLVIATHGRSMYVLEGLAPVREARPAGAAAPALQVFAPRVATRGVDEAVVQYALARPADTVRVEVLDAAGRVVRSFTGGRAGADSAGGAPPPRATRRRAARPRATRSCSRAGASRRGGARGRSVPPGGRGSTASPGTCGTRRLDLRVHGDLERGARSSGRSPSRRLPGARHRRRRERDAPARRAHRPGPQGGRRRRPACAVRPRRAHPRPRLGGERRRGAHPRLRSGIADRVAPRAGRGARRRGRHGAARGRRGAALPGAQPERAGPAQLPDQAQQQARLARPLGADRARAPHRGGARGVRGAVGGAGPGARGARPGGGRRGGRLRPRRPAARGLAGGARRAVSARGARRARGLRPAR
jgi:photosystem II stability/assembly factor-like uncharacterized protein